MSKSLLGLAVVTGTGEIVFVLYSSEIGGDSLWAGQHSVFVDKGTFSTVLSKYSTLNLDFSLQYWLEIRVDKIPFLSPLEANFERVCIARRCGR